MARLTGSAIWRSTGKNIYIHTYSVHPSSSWTQNLSLPICCPWIPVSSCWHMGIQMPEAAAPLQLLVQTASFIPMHVHAHLQSSAGPPWSPVASPYCSQSSYTQIHTLTHSSHSWTPPDPSVFLARTPLVPLIARSSCGPTLRVALGSQATWPPYQLVCLELP